MVLNAYPACQIQRFKCGNEWRPTIIHQHLSQFEIRPTKAFQSRHISCCQDGQGSKHNEFHPTKPFTAAAALSLQYLPAKLLSEQNSIRICSLRSAQSTFPSHKPVMLHIDHRGLVFAVSPLQVASAVCPNLSPFLPPRFRNTHAVAIIRLVPGAFVGRLASSRVVIAGPAAAARRLDQRVDQLLGDLQPGSVAAPPAWRHN